MQLARLLHSPGLAGARIQHGVYLLWPHSLMPASRRRGLEESLVPNAERFWQLMRAPRRDYSTTYSSWSSLKWKPAYYKCDQCHITDAVGDRIDAIVALFFTLAGAESILQRRDMGGGGAHFRRCGCFPQLRSWNARAATFFRAVVRHDNWLRAEIDLIPFDPQDLMDAIASGQEFYRAPAWIVVNWRCCCIKTDPATF